MKVLFSLAGKQALVTGGAQGLGRMIAEGLLQAGAAVAITSRDGDVAQQAAADMARIGQCTAYAADLSTPEGATDLAGAVRKTSRGRLSFCARVPVPT